MSFDARNPFFYRTVLFLTLVELLSLFGYLLPLFNTMGFFILVVIALLLAFLRFEYLLYFILVELFIGSKGFLFYFVIDNTIISLRMALWILAIGIWCGRFLLFKEERQKWRTIIEQPLVRWMFIMLAVVGLATLHGAIRNTFANVFFDVNGWLYLLLLFPFLSTFREERHVHTILHLLMAGVLVGAVKALAILFIYAHDPLGGVFLPLYRWVRNSGVGEVTAITPTFARVFFQSQIYTLIAFFVLLALPTEKDFRVLVTRYSLLVLFFSSILLSFSRSFWLAGIVTIALFLFVRRFRGIGEMGVISALGFLLILGIMNFPYPRTAGGSFANLIEQRATDAEEAGASSRWSLLPPLWGTIRSHWFLGAGFGKTVTYKSSDPRIVQSSARGNSFYTTYAFEWGYLDLWLKLGFVGLLVYLIVLGKIGRALLRVTNYKPAPYQRESFGARVRVTQGFLFGFIALLITNIFSPYLNHPLGLGYLLLLLCVSVSTVASPAVSKA